MTWLARSSLNLLSNFGISEGILVGILDHVGSCNMGSFKSLLKSRMLRDAKYVMGVEVEDYFHPWCEQVVDLTLEGGLVGLYFSLENKFPPHLLVKES
jgi:hypothetical protein